jgi:transcriptional regulator with XRE-family HTH domain
MPRAIQEPLSPLAELRASRNLSRPQTSALVGLSRQRILQIEQRGMHDIDTMEALAAAYGVTLDEIARANRATRKIGK